MKNINTRSDTDEIIAYLQFSGDPEDAPVLSKKLQEKLERYYHCEGLIRTYGSRLKVGPMLMSKYGISRATAYRDFEDTQAVFGTTQRSNKQFWLDVLLGLMMDTRRKAEIDRDWNAVKGIEKNMKDAIRELAGDSQTLPFDKVQPVTVKIGVFPELLNVPLPENWRDQVKEMLNPKRQNNIQDAEVVKDGEE